MVKFRTDRRLPLIARARAFATDWHGSINQLRDYIGEPYITHAEAVAALVSSFTDDERLIVAAWLHDVVEDTPCTLADVEEEFGAEIAALVAMLTKVSRRSDGDRATRRAIDRAHTAKASSGAKTVKLADVHHNLSTIENAPLDFGRLYVQEKRLLLPFLREGHPELYLRTKDMVRWAYQVVGLDFALAS